MTGTHGAANVKIWTAEKINYSTQLRMFFFQHVKNPTREGGLDTSNVLNLKFTNEEGMISDLEYGCSPLGKSDHSVLKFKHNSCISRAVYIKNNITSQGRLSWNEKGTKRCTLGSKTQKQQFKTVGINFTKLY